MPLLILLLHVVLLSTMVGMVPWKFLARNPKVATFRGGFAVAFCFGLSYTFSTYGIVLILWGMGVIPGLNGITAALLNILWIIGSGGYLYLFARINSNRFQIHDSTAAWMGGLAMFLSLMISTMTVGFLSRLLGA